MTPLHMIILIECNITRVPGSNIDSAMWNSPMAEQYRLQLEDMGMITQDFREHGSPVWTATDKGKAWLDKALSTPMPVQKWVFEDNKPNFIGGEAA